jgi:hypothetical protein
LTRSSSWPIRATLLYDSIVLRLDHQLDRYSEYLQYMKDRAQSVKLKWRKRLQDSTGDALFLQLEDLGKSMNDLVIRTQATLSRLIVNLGSTVDKWVFATSVLSRMAGRILLVTILGMVLVNIVRYLSSEPITYMIALSTVAQNKFYQLFLILAAVFNIRHILFRQRDRDTI